MRKLFLDVRALGGLASMDELLRRGHWRDAIEIAVTYRSLIRVRKGWYAEPGEPEEVMRAWRVGGRLACLSAMAFHHGVPGDGFLHVEVAGNAARLRSPDDPRRPLSPQDPVVVHWATRREAGDRRVVSQAAALRQIAACRVAQSPLGRHGSSPAAPPSGLSPPRRR